MGSTPSRLGTACEVVVLHTHADLALVLEYFARQVVRVLEQITRTPRHSCGELLEESECMISSTRLDGA